MTEAGADCGLRALNTPRAWAVDLAACAAVGVLLGVVGPFGSFFNDELPVRVAYWTTVLLLAGGAFGAAVRWLWPRARRHGVPVWAWVPGLALVLSVPLTVLTRLVASAFWRRIGEAVGPVEWYGQVVMIGLVWLALYVAFRSRTGSAGRPAEPAVGEAPRILDRLPGRLGRDLLCLQMEDHYVRLHTPQGSVLVLMPLGRAVAELGSLEGMRVHRSWWVARHAVEGVVQDGRKLRLRLTSGLEAPVARAKVVELRALGWLDRAA